jgi:hypothetical protein
MCAVVAAILAAAAASVTHGSDCSAAGLGRAPAALSTRHGLWMPSRCWVAAEDGARLRGRGFVRWVDVVPQGCRGDTMSLWQTTRKG